MAIKTDILIVGAGPVGLTAALELSRRGFNPIIIDNDGVPTPQSRALAIQPRSLDIFEPSGVSQKLITAGNKINHIQLVQNGETRMKLDFSELPHKHNFLLCLPQSQTEEILIDALAENGISIHWHHELQDVEIIDDGYICSIIANDRTHKFHAKTLIGADGAHSRVRKSLGFDFDGQSTPGVWSLADIKLKDWPNSTDTAIANIRDNQLGGYIPMSENFGRFISPKPNVVENLPADAKVKEVTWQSEFTVSYRQVSTYQKGNVFLAGDAAHIHSPMGGRGMNLGIEDAACLAWLIEKENTIQYTALRHPIGKKVLAFTKQQTNLLSKGGLKRDLILRFVLPLAISFKTIRKRALKQVTGLDMPAPPWL